ncbi:SDR family oxidoreductase [Streptomyces sp. NPDC058284]|uniref:SDR family oxidoreductase n=1 Tax=unclassified Streptomyces TaxID=2593676 RepID=UPI00365ECE06
MTTAWRSWPKNCVSRAYRLYCVGDVQVATETRRAVAHAVDTHGRLDVACNNAGTAVERTPLRHMDDATYELVLDANARRVGTACAPISAQ